MTTSTFTESVVEEAVLAWLEALGVERDVTKSAK